jgi:hypothetical protein
MRAAAATAAKIFRCISLPRTGYIVVGTSRDKSVRRVGGKVYEVSIAIKAFGPPSPRPIHYSLSAVALAFAMCGCASAPLTQGGSLSSYDNMTPADGKITKSLLRINDGDVLAAKTVKIVPTKFSAAAALVPFSDRQRKMIGNAVDRSLCLGLSERFRILPPWAPTDLTVHAVITDATVTDEVAAGASKVVSIIPAALSLGVPVPVPRLPIGLGSLSMEAEAQGPTGEQKAAMVWARGANSISNRPQVSKAADAYDLATSFGDDFSQFLVTGKSPFNQAPSAPSMQKIGAALGSSPKNAACEAFGKDPGIKGMIAGGLGMPPEWSDDGAAKAKEETKQETKQEIK